MSVIFSQCKTKEGQVFEGLYIVQPGVFKDSRGCFAEVFNLKDFESHFPFNRFYSRFVQDNESNSAKHVLRGLHFQKKHCQAKLVRCAAGKVYDVVLDLRKGSKTFGKFFSIVLDSSDKKQLFVPKGFAHGFLTLADNTVCCYKTSDYYFPEDEGGILFSDLGLNIDWNKETVADFELSSKDKVLPLFDLTADYFDMDGNWIGE